MLSFVSAKKRRFRLLFILDRESAVSWGLQQQVRFFRRQGFGFVTSYLE